MIKSFLVLLALFSSFSYAFQSELDKSPGPSFNKIVNPGFEALTAGWSGVGLSTTTTAANVAEGRRAAIFNATAPAQTLQAGAQIVTAGDGYSGQPGIFTCRFKCETGQTCTHYIAAFDGTSDLGVPATIVSSDSQFIRTKTYFTYPVSGTVFPTIYAVAADEPSLYVDSCFMGLAESFSSGSSSVTGWQSYTPTFNGIGTATNINFMYREVGDAVEISGFFTTGTTTATEFRVGLPTGYIAKSQGGKKVAQGSITYDSYVATNPLTPFYQDLFSYIRAGYWNGSGNTTAANGSTIFANNTDVNIHMMVPIYPTGLPTPSVNPANQMYFKATAGSTAFAGTQTTIVFPNVATGDDPLGMYNTGTGIMTVPVGGDGRWVCHSNLMFQGTVSNGQATAVTINKNGTNKQSAYYKHQSSLTGENFSQQVETQLTLQAGDTVNIVAESQASMTTFNSDLYTWFECHRIYQ